MAGYDGSVRINTKMDTSGATSGVSTLSSAFKKLGGVIASVFAVSKIISFGKEAIELASDLEEVQNVVDTAFGSMSDKANEFAQSALKNFGLSELSAKQYSSTFMSMAKSLGLSTDSATDMSLELTGLVGDVASFYNLDQDVAASKLKAVFTGETEGLKELGVVMSQTNLQQYAYTQGINKSINEMSQAELVSLRYAYVTNALSLAQGDFAKTSDSWANQTRILSETFKSLSAVIGELLINVLTPAVKYLNLMMEQMLSIANEAKSFFIGDETSSSNNSIATSAESATEAQEEVTEAIEETQEAAAGNFASFDEINTVDYGTDLTSSDSTDESERVDSIATAAGEAETVARETQSTIEELFGYVEPAITLIKTLVTDLIMVGKELFETVIKPLGSVALSIFQKLSEVILALYTNAIRPLGGVLKEKVLPPIQSIIGSAKTLIDEAISPALELLEKKLSPVIKSVGTLIITYFGNSLSGTAKLIKLVVSAITSFVGGLNEGSSAADVLSGACEAVSGILQNIVDYVNDMLPQIVKFVKTILTKAVSVIKTYLPVILEAATSITQSVIETVLECAPTILEAVADIILAVIECTVDVLPTILEAVANVVFSIIETIVEEIPTFVDTILQIVEKVITTLTDNLPQLLDTVIEIILAVIDGIINAIPQIVDAISQIITSLLNYIIDMFPAIVECGIKIILSLVEGLVASVDKIREAAMTLVTSLIQMIIDNIPAIIEAAITIVESLANGIIEAIPKLVDAAIQLVVDLVNFVLDNLPLIIEAAIELVIAIVEGIIEAIPRLVEAAVGIVSGLIEMLADPDRVTDLINTGITLLERIIEGLLEAIPQLMEATPQIIEAIWNAFTNIDWPSLGKNIITGIGQGFINSVKSIGEKIADGCKSLWSGIKSFFGINSPSRLMRDTVGNYIADGIGEGFEDEIGDVTDDMTSALADELDLGAMAEAVDTDSDVYSSVENNYESLFSRLKSLFAEFLDYITTSTATFLDTLSTGFAAAETRDTTFYEKIKLMSSESLAYVITSAGTSTYDTPTTATEYRYSGSGNDGELLKEVRGIRDDLASEDSGGSIVIQIVDKNGNVKTTNTINAEKQNRIAGKVVVPVGS